MSRTNTISFRRRHLPHWMVADCTYFVTFRLKGSLPTSVVEELVHEKEMFLSRERSEQERTDFERLRFQRIDAMLDAARIGPQSLNFAPVADIVFEAFDWLEQSKGWNIKALTVMPNHVHAVLRNVAGRNHCLNQDMGILKGFTARRANDLLEKSGCFWMGENFDHWCRSEAHVLRAVRYTAQNPVKAGLVENWRDWPWTKVGQAFLPDLERGLNKN